MNIGRLGGALALTLVALPLTAWAGPWTKELGQHYAKLGGDLYYTTDYFDSRLQGSDGETGIQRFVGTNLTLYGEVGVFPLWPIQVTASLPLTVGVSTFKDPALIGTSEPGTATGVRLGDLRVALQTSILRKGFQLAPSVEVKIPMYANDVVGKGLGPYRQWVPIPGDGQIDITPMMLMGGSIPTKVPMWVEGGIGYRFRTEAFVRWNTNLEFVDGIPFYAAWGLAPGRSWVVLRVDGYKNVRDDDVSREAVTIGPSVGVTVWKGLAIEARLAGDVVANNAPRGIAAGLGVSWRYPFPAASDASSSDGATTE
ncbi:MAG: hypothetical protein KDA24_08135 [Deltaproteobacteria bacterium]|nr:hypothetical protein [Deltaproteobacteria bacterium]